MARCVDCGLPGEKCKCTNGPVTMSLPPGKTCNDCGYFKRCCAFLGDVSGNTECDWFPVRFMQAKEAAS